MSFNTGGNDGSKLIGINTFQVLAINPSIEQLTQMGIKTDNFKGYVNEEKEQVRFDVWVNRKDIPFPVKLNFWLGKPKESSKGTWQYVDKFGKSTWAANDKELRNKDYSSTNSNNETYNWFDVDSARKAYQGEVAIGKSEMALTEFMRMALWIPMSREGRIDNPEAFFKGDFSEVQGYIPNMHEIILALGVENDKYYKIYPKAGASTYAKKGSSFNFDAQAKKIADILDANQTYIKAYFGESPYTWSKFTPVPEGETQEYPVPVEETVETVGSQEKLPWDN